MSRDPVSSEISFLLIYYYDNKIEIIKNTWRIGDRRGKKDTWEFSFHLNVSSQFFCCFSFFCISFLLITSITVDCLLLFLIVIAIIIVLHAIYSRENLLFCKKSLWNRDMAFGNLCLLLTVDLLDEWLRLGSCREVLDCKFEEMRHYVVSLASKIPHFWK